VDEHVTHTARTEWPGCNAVNLARMCESLINVMSPFRTFEGGAYNRLMPGGFVVFHSFVTPRDSTFFPHTRSSFVWFLMDLRTR